MTEPHENDELEQHPTARALGLRMARVPDEPRPSPADVEVPDTSVHLAYPTSDRVHVLFHRSVAHLEMWERQQAKALGRSPNFSGELMVRSGANISKARNELVRIFLDETDSEWLWFVDTDMAFEPDTLARLLCAAECSGAKAVGALCCMIDTTDGPIPTIYQWAPQFGPGAVTHVSLDYPDRTLLQVAGTGTGCLLMHRSALEAVAEAHPGVRWPWFTETEINGAWVSEDMHACLQFNLADQPVFVDTSTPVGHAKGGRVWWPKDIRDRRGFPPQRTWVVVPFLEREDLTGELVEQLEEQGGWHDLVLVDNGSTSEGTRSWLDGLQRRALETWHDRRLHVLTMPDAGIHEMWNAAVDLVVEAGQRRNSNVVFLNNDVKLGADAIAELVRALRAHNPGDGKSTAMAVGANYDAMIPLPTAGEAPLVPVGDICAGRYSDGVPRFGGFAFAVRFEWFLHGYRFPTELKWYCGDTHLLIALQMAGHFSALALRSRITVVDGGSQTVNARAAAEPAFAEQLAADQAKFAAMLAELSAGSMRSLEETYEALCAEPSDIRAHLPRLVDLVRGMRAKKVIELGVRSGRSTVAFLHALEQTDGNLWSVDVDHCPIGHPRLTFVQGDDLAADVRMQLPRDADVIFIDTSHEYGQTFAELNAYVDHLGPGGAFVLHDTAHERFDHHGPDEPAFPVATALAEWLAERPEADAETYTDDHGLSIVWPFGRDRVSDAVRPRLEHDHEAQSA